MIEFITSNKEAIFGIATAVLVLAGTIVKITANKRDDSVFNTIVNSIGLGRFAVPTDEVDAPK